MIPFVPLNHASPLYATDEETMAVTNELIGRYAELIVPIAPFAEIVALLGV